MDSGIDAGFPARLCPPDRLDEDSRLVLSADGNLTLGDHPARKFHLVVDVSGERRLRYPPQPACPNLHCGELTGHDQGPHALGGELEAFGDVVDREEHSVHTVMLAWMLREVSEARGYVRYVGCVRCVVAVVDIDSIMRGINKCCWLW